MEMTNNEFFSNAGNRGTELRQDNRAYRNEESYIVKGDEAEAIFRELLDSPIVEGENITRFVYRTLMSSKAFTKLSPFMAQRVEVATNLCYLDHAGMLVYFAENIGERKTPLVSHETIISETRATQRENRPKTPPHELISNLPSDFKIIGTLEGEHIQQLDDLYRHHFYWEDGDIEGLALGLRDPESMVWLAAITCNNQIVSSAMGDHIQLIGSNGPVDLVENTEWVTTQAGNFRGRGLLTAASAAIIAQCIEDLQDRNGPPIVYAECNRTSRSDVVAQNIGMRIPHGVKQILTRHVRVNDGFEPQGETRDFTFLELPINMRNKYYNDELRASILSNVQRGSEITNVGS